MKMCTLLTVQQQIFISHGCYNLGLEDLSSTWSSKVLGNIDELRLSDQSSVAQMKQKAKAILRILSVTKKKPCSEDRLSLYESGLLALEEGCSERPRLFVHFALVAALQKGLLTSAAEILKRTTEIYVLPNPPGYYDEFLHANDLNIIIQVKEGNMNGAIQEMHRRVDAVSNWIGNTSLELANGLYRLACFYSLTGHNEQCVKYLKESLHIGTDLDEYDSLSCDCIKLLAVTFDDSDKADEAICKYEQALDMEEDIIMKVKLINALAHRLIKVGGHSQLAVSHLQMAMDILQNHENSENIILCDTMILCGNQKASENSFAEAIGWYESALSSNPHKSTVNPTNLRALFNKGN